MWFNAPWSHYCSPRVCVQHPYNNFITKLLVREKLNCLLLMTTFTHNPSVSSSASEPFLAFSLREVFDSHLIFIAKLPHNLIHCIISGCIETLKFCEAINADIEALIARGLWLWPVLGMSSSHPSKANDFAQWIVMSFVTQQEIRNCSWVTWCYDKHSVIALRISIPFTQFHKVVHV